MLIDDILRNQSPDQPALAELTDTLTSLISSNELSKELEAQLSFILEKILSSPKNIKNFIIFSFNEIAAEQQAVVERVINSEPTPTPADCIDALFKQLNYASYLPKFAATFKSFIQIDKANQEQIDHIKTRLSALETHCSALKDLVSKYHKELDKLQSNADTETLDCQNELAQQLSTLTNHLGGGDYFQAIQTEVLNFLTKLQENVKSRLQRDEATIQTIYQQVTNHDKQIKELVTEHNAKRLEIESWLENRINQYQRLKTLQEIINFGEVRYQEISNRYDQIRTEIAEYRVVLQVLNDANVYSSWYGDITPVLVNTKDPIEHTALTERLSNKLFFLLEKAKRDDLDNYLENLLQFLAGKEKETQGIPSDTELLIRLRNKFRQSVAERLEYFINDQRPEEICQQLCVTIMRKKDHSLYKLLNYFTFDTLNKQLSTCSIDSHKHSALQSIISTKNLLELLTPPGSAVDEPKVVFRDIWKLFDDFNKGRAAPPLLIPEERALFDAAQNAINAFMQCIADIDSESNYTSSFFLKGGESKREAIKKLVKLMGSLTLDTPPEELKKIFREWENKYGELINKPRYKQLIIAHFMAMYHLVNELFGNFFQTKPFQKETRTRIRINRLDAAFSIANESISQMTRSL